MSKDKVTNIDKTPNDFVKEKAEEEGNREAQEREDRLAKDPSHQEYIFINPVTNKKESLPRFLLRSRLAQWTHYICDEITRLNAVHDRCMKISAEIDKQKANEEEADNG